MSTRAAKVTVYHDETGRFRWRWVAANGRILADSGQGYRRLTDCWIALEAVTGGCVRITFGRRSGYKQGLLARGCDGDGRELPDVFVEVLP